MIKGIIFDYNGTLIFDEPYNKEAWKQCLEEFTHNKVDFDWFYPLYGFKMNYQVLHHACDIYDLDYSEEEINKWAHYKEELYHKKADESGQYILRKDVEEFFNYIKERNIPCNIATQSIKYNCDFYFDRLQLYKWFNQDLIGYDNGKYELKRYMYKDAANNIGLDIKDCLVIEDSYLSIQEAIVAGCKNVICMNSRNLTIDLPEVKQVVNSFAEIDKTIFD